jgi:hypothetical protein
MPATYKPISSMEAWRDARHILGQDMALGVRLLKLFEGQGKHAELYSIKITWDVVCGT